MMRPWIVVGLWLGWASGAQAQGGETPPAASTDSAASSASAESADSVAPPSGDDHVVLSPRKVPDYDGRPPPPTTPGEALAWIPRVLLFPVYFVMEYLVRRPLGFVVSRAERVDAAGRAIRFFHFGDKQQYALYPTFTFQSAFRPKIGFGFSAIDVLADKNKLFASFDMGGFRRGVSVIGAGIGDRQTLGDFELYLRASFSRRDDGRFFGIGSENQNRTIATYDYDRAQVEAGVSFSRAHAFLQYKTGYRYQQFGNDVGARRTTIVDAIDQGIVSEAPPGFDRGLSIHFNRLEMILDSRPDRPKSQNGIRLRTVIDANYDLRDPSDSAWLTYGGSIGGFLDVSGVNHILGLSISAGVIEELKGEVPFTELLAPSGNGPLSGFVQGFLLGESMLVANLEYTWPIWYWLDGIAHFGIGNTFDGRFDGFAFDRLRMSWGIGVAAIVKRDHFFEFELGWGTDTFENGPNVESFRLAIGARRDF